MTTKENIPNGIFATGCIVGLVLAYTNIVGFLAGVITGIFIQASGPDVGSAIMSVVLNAISCASSVVKATSLVKPSNAKE